jgi:hypothetical protein
MPVWPPIGLIISEDAPVRPAIASLVLRSLVLHILLLVILTMLLRIRVPGIIHVKALPDRTSRGIHSGIAHWDGRNLPITGCKVRGRAIIACPVIVRVWASVIIAMEVRLAWGISRVHRICVHTLWFLSPILISSGVGRLETSTHRKGGCWFIVNINIRQGGLSWCNNLAVFVLEMGKVTSCFLTSELCLSP